VSSDTTQVDILLRRAHKAWTDFASSTELDPGMREIPGLCSTNRTAQQTFRAGYEAIEALAYAMHIHANKDELTSLQLMDVTRILFARDVIPDSLGTPHEYSNITWAADNLMSVIDAVN
jgi:hypothetical protein